MNGAPYHSPIVIQGFGSGREGILTPDFEVNS